MTEFDFRHKDYEIIGKDMMKLAQELFSICRSITGDGFRKSINILEAFYKNDKRGGAFNKYEIKSGTKVYDWEVPDEWHIKDAYIITPENEKICDFKKHNLHVLNYSTAVNDEISLEELQNHLYSNEKMPDSIPYVTSYYKRRWGFCISHNERKKLKQGLYKVYIDAEHDKNGVLNYADFFIKADKKSKDEVLISSYLCHPSMANNELSGPIILTFLAKWLKGIKNKKYNYRFVLIPETIGSIVYINKNLKELKKRVKAGFVLSCLGDDDNYSLIHSPKGNSLSDKIALHTYKNKENFKEFSFLFRGSDERQFNSPLVNLGVVGICRTRYADFKQYHTSADDLNYISAKGLLNSLKSLQELILNLECNDTYKSTVFCEPNLGKRGLYPTLNLDNKKPIISDLLAFLDGERELFEVANILDMQTYELKDLIDSLLKHKLIKRVKNEK